MAPPSAPEDPYGILGVARTASPQEITRAFRRQAKLLHPDKNSGRDTSEEFRRLQRAYAILGHPETRHEFDRRGADLPVTPVAPEVVSVVPIVPVAAVPARRRTVRYVLAGVVAVAALAGGLVHFALETWIEPARALRRPAASGVTLEELERDLEAAMSKYAREYTGSRPPAPEVELVGRDGRTYLLTAEVHQRLRPAYERLLTEAAVLKKRREEMDVRRQGLETEKRALAASDAVAMVAFGMKLDEFNRAGQSLHREVEVHVRDVETFFKEVERQALRVR